MMLRILVLDDDEQFCQMLSMRLEPNRRFMVKIASTVQQARLANAIQSFDVFLIELNLRAQHNGIDVMQELLTINGTTDAIIMSDRLDAEIGQRAYQAGAKRCFCKDFCIDELILTLDSLYEQQRARNERKWLKIITEVAEKAQQSQSVKDVAQVVVQGALRLGFKRARLWLLDESESLLLGISQSGVAGLEDFASICISVEQSVYSQRILEKRDPTFFQGLQLGTADLFAQDAHQKFLPPKGEWVGIPLWSSDRPLGILTLDDADEPTILPLGLDDCLRLFGTQVAAVVERTQLQEKEHRKTEQLYDLNHIKPHISNLAAHSKLLMRLMNEEEESLWHVALAVAMAGYALRFNRAPQLQETLNEIVQAARQAAPDVSVLTIWYREPEHNQLILGPHFGVDYEEMMPRQKEEEDSSVVWHVMHSAEPIWAAVLSEDLRLKGRFVHDEKIVSSAALPLRVNDEEIGAIFFSYREHHEFTNEEKVLFSIFAEIVADSVREATLLEAVRKERDRLDAARAITDAVGTTLDVEDILHKVMAVLRDRLFPDTNICVTTYNETEQCLEFTTVSREFYQSEALLERKLLQIPLERGSIACSVAKASLASQQIEILNKSNVKDEAYLPLIKSTQSKICISLISSDHRLLGVLALESPIQHRFDKEDEALLRHVSQTISLAMERAYQSAQLQFHTTIAATTSWAAEIAHDIRNEVGRIRNRTYWLSEDRQLTAQERIYVDEIEESAERLAWTGKSADALRARPVKQLLIDSWLKETVQSFIADKHRSVYLTFDLQCADVAIYAIESALRNALQHLVRNALEAMEEQKCGTLIIRSKRLDHQQIEVQIEDSGLGLHETIRQTLFHKPKSTKTGSERGFGLLFTRYAIQQMGGRIRTIPATVLTGTCFAFTLPVIQSHFLEKAND